MPNFFNKRLGSWPGSQNDIEQRLRHTRLSMISAEMFLFLFFLSKGNPGDPISKIVTVSSLRVLADGGGFEPPVPFGTHALQACTINRSVTHPSQSSFSSAS